MQIYSQSVKTGQPREIQKNDAEIKRDMSVNATTVHENPLNKLICHFSEWLCLKKTVSWMITVLKYTETNFPLSRRSETKDEQFNEVTEGAERPPGLSELTAANTLAQRNVSYVQWEWMCAYQALLSDIKRRF